MEDDWIEVPSRKQNKAHNVKKTQKEKKETTLEVVKEIVRESNDTQYLLSDLIKTEICIHCLNGKCKLPRSHNNVPFPHEFTQYIQQPGTIDSELDKILREKLHQVPLFKGKEVRPTICLFNHCLKKCRNGREGRCDFIELEDGQKLHYCYTDSVQMNRRMIYVGIHLDIMTLGVGEKPAWRFFHNEIHGNEEEMVDAAVAATIETRIPETYETEYPTLSTPISSPVHFGDEMTQTSKKSNSSYLEKLASTRLSVNIDDDNSTIASVNITPSSNIIMSPQSSYIKRGRNTPVQMNRNQGNTTPRVNFQDVMNENRGFYQYAESRMEETHQMMAEYIELQKRQNEMLKENLEHTNRIVSLMEIDMSKMKNDMNRLMRENSELKNVVLRKIQFENSITQQIFSKSSISSYL